VLSTLAIVALFNPLEPGAGIIDLHFTFQYDVARPWRLWHLRDGRTPAPGRPVEEVIWETMRPSPISMAVLLSCCVYSDGGHAPAGGGKMFHSFDGQH
jgi:hypothetical protein